MTTPQALFAGAACIAMAIFAAATIRPAAALQTGIGPYQLMNHSNTSTNVGLFKIDTMSGEVSFCYVTGQTDVVCSKPAK